VAQTHLDLEGFHARAERIAASALPRLSQPPESEFDAYLRGVAHGYATAITWAEVMLRATQDVAVLTRAGAVADFLSCVSKTTTAMSESRLEDLVVFKSPSEHDDVESRRESP
jgi:hypothetical protein